MSHCRTSCCASFVSFLQGFDELRIGLQVHLGLACHVVAGHLDQEPWPSISQGVGLVLIQRSPDAILFDANGPRKECVAHYDHEEAKGANGRPIELALTRGLELIRFSLAWGVFIFRVYCHHAKWRADLRITLDQKDASYAGGEVGAMWQGNAACNENGKGDY
jgi:hypothetical protein